MKNERNLLSRRLKIVNVHRGLGGRKKFVYAELRDAETDEVLISATIDYIAARLTDQASN